MKTQACNRPSKVLSVQEVTSAMKTPPVKSVRMSLRESPRWPWTMRGVHPAHRSCH
jgi:hypothetical protein